MDTSELTEELKDAIASDLYARWKYADCFFEEREDFKPTRFTVGSTDGGVLAVFTLQDGRKLTYKIKIDLTEEAR